MKTTYKGTMMIKDLTKAVVELHIYDNCKYTNKRAELGKEIVVRYTGVKSYSIIDGGKEAEEIESLTDPSGIDEYHEYLVLNFENGTTITFGNSHVDMFLF